MIEMKEAVDLLGAALEAARMGAALAKKGWRKHPTPARKASQVDLVTQFDLDSEALLRQELTRRTAFPIVGEEGGGDATAQGPVWYVDPIDGTTNFVHGHPFWCVSVGLVEAGRPLLGAVVAPVLAVEWTAVAGAQARRNDEVCRVSEVHAFNESLLATGFPYDRHTSADNNFDTFIAIKKQCQAVRRCGSAAIDLCLVADGTYEGYWENKVKAWDVAAGAAIVVAAGGRVSDYAGHDVDVRGGQIVATNGRIHGTLVESIGRARTGQ
jgi:myo-inositol-1(or 4)-monophosphatase